MVTKKKSDFVTFSLPRETVDEIDSFIRDSKNNDQLFQKRPDVVKVALARFFKKNNGGMNDGDNIKV